MYIIHQVHKGHNGHNGHKVNYPEHRGHIEGRPIYWL